MSGRVVAAARDRLLFNQLEHLVKERDTAKTNDKRDRRLHKVLHYMNFVLYGVLTYTTVSTFLEGYWFWIPINATIGGYLAYAHVKLIRSYRRCEEVSARYYRALGSMMEAIEDQLAIHDVDAN